MNNYENSKDRNAERSVGIMRLMYDFIPTILSSQQGVKLT